MKKLAYTALLAFISFTGCKKDDEFLKETPGDFLTVDNAFLNFAQFKTGLNELYRLVRMNYDNRDSGDDFFHFGSGTDNIFVPVPANAAYTDWTIINPTRGIFNDVFTRHYQIIFHANNILKQSENPDISLTADEKKIVQAEARFFRAYAHRYLSYLFGAVPIVDKAVTQPRLDFTRNTRAEVYAFCVEDFKFAAENLPKTTAEPGRLVKAAADHYLAEMYIALGDETKDASNYTKAIQAASRVIDGADGDYHLMTQRFGWRKDVPGKNVFWDMFQMRSTNSYSNYNYQNGNKEAIWVMQIDKYLPGGLNSTMPRTDQERAFWPSFWALQKFGYSGPARDWTGRGISMVRPTDYFNYYLWNNSGSGDMRNDPTNIQRVFYAPDPIINGVEVPNYDTVYKTNVTLFDGSKIVVELRPGDPIKPEWLTSRQDTMERVFPRVMKMGSDWHYNGDPSNGFAQESYAIRLAETYLVRAEAYLKAGDKAKAAADINVVRNRAGAIPVTPGEVNIDYILDERIRELFGEELHTLTLTRLGLLYDRTKKFGQELSKQTVTPANNLMPIPQKVIDANSLADFPQNPGY